MGSLITHTGTFSIDDRLASQWQYLPVEVPPGTGALRVTLSYPRDAAAVLDLGCLDPAGVRGGTLAGGDRAAPGARVGAAVHRDRGALVGGLGIARRAAFFMAGGAGRAA